MEVPAVVEAASTSEVQETTPDKSASKYIAELARKEKEFRAREEALKSRESEWHSKEKEYQTKYISKDMLKSNPYAALTESGLNEEEVMSMLMNPPNQTDLKIKTLESRIESLMKSLEERDSKAQESTTAAYQKALDSIRSDAKDLVEASEEFEVIKASGEDGIEAVVRYIEDEFKKSGKQIPVDKAAAAIEEQFLEHALKFAQLNKIKQKTLGEVTQPETGKQQGLNQTKTLTHQNTTTTAKPLSARERAIAAFKGELK